MTEPGGQGWRDDPSGRFRSRWHDGATWTDHVVGPDGAVTTDPFTQQQPYQQPGWQQQPPGWQQPQPSYQQPAQPSWQQPPAQQGYQQPTYPAAGYQPGGYTQPGSPGWTPRGAGAYGSSARYLPGPGIAAGALGLLCLVLSLFALDWAKGGNGKFLDLRRALNHIPDSVDLKTGQSLMVAYTTWAAFVLFGLAVVLVALAGIPFPQTAAGNTYARIVGALIAGLGAVGQIITITQAFKGPASPQFGAWLGLIGWAVVAVGFVLGARRVVT